MTATTRRTATLLASIFLAAGALPGAGAQAADSPGERRVALVALAEGDALVYAATLADATARELATEGFDTLRLAPASLPAIEAGSEERSEAARAAKAAAGASAGWSAVILCSVEGRRLTWRLSIYDARDAALVAADTGSAFAGASAVAALEASARAAARRANAAANRGLPAGLVAEPLSYGSGDEGAELRLGDERGPVLGRVKDGRVEADYLPFASGRSLSLTVTKHGYWPVTFVAPTEDRERALPRLMRKSGLSLGLGTSPNRLAGLAGELRYYPLPDSLFARLGLQAWLRDDGLAGSPPSLHAEGRLGAAAYLFLPPGSRLRVSAGLGLAALATMLGAEASRPNAYLDLSLELPSISIEWHWPGFAVYLEQRLGYSLGLSGGLLARGWWRTGAGPMALAMGVMLKWP